MIPFQISCDTPSLTVNSSSVVGRSTWAHYLDHSFSVLFCPCFIPWLSSTEKAVYHFFLFFKWEWKENQKIHKPLCLWSPFSTKALFSRRAGFQRLLGLHVWYSVMQQVFFLFHSFSPSLSHSLSLTVFLMHQQRYRWFSPYCHSAVSRIWRSILWRRAWEEQTNQRGEMRRKCDWLACGGRGGKRNMHTQ